MQRRRQLLVQRRRPARRCDVGIDPCCAVLRTGLRASGRASSFAQCRPGMRIRHRVVKMAHSATVLFFGSGLRTLQLLRQRRRANRTLRKRQCNGVPLQARVERCVSPKLLPPRLPLPETPSDFCVFEEHSHLSVRAEDTQRQPVPLLQLLLSRRLLRLLLGASTPNFSTDRH